MQFLMSYCNHWPICLKARLKVQKGHTIVNINFGRNFDMENIAPCNVTWCSQILRSYHIHDVLSPSAILLWPSFKSSKRLHKGQCWTPRRSWCGEHSCKVAIWYIQFFSEELLCSQGVTVCHPFDLDLVWREVQKGHTKKTLNKAEILIWRTPLYKTMYAISKELSFSQSSWLFVA